MTDKKKPRIEIAPSTDKDDGTWCTFILHDEDHTLGNALRYVIMKNPEVEFCGYSVPHPSENKIHLRIQTRGTSALSVLERGLKDLSALCGHVLKTFEAAVLDYKLHYPVEEMDGDMEGTSS